MCMFKSAIILKDRVFIPDYDHHTQMLEELGIKDNQQNAETLFVRAELIPPNSDFFSDIDTWQFKVDQDIRPDWFVEEYEAGRMTSAVKEWAKNRIYIGVSGLTLTTGANYYLKDCHDVILKGDCAVYRIQSSTVGEMRESSTVRQMRESSTVGQMRGSSTVGEMWGSSTVGQMRESSTVGEMRGSSTVRQMRESSTVRQMWGSSTVGEMWESSTAIIAGTWSDNVKAESIIHCDNATIKDNRTKTIYQSGDWKMIATNNQ